MMKDGVRIAVLRGKVIEFGPMVRLTWLMDSEWRSDYAWFDGMGCA